MQNIKSTVLSALQTATALATLTGFFFNYPQDFINLPVLSYFELDNKGDLYADNIEIASEMIYQIDLWGRQNLSNFGLGVNSAMTSIDFARISSIDLYEQDVKLYHKSLRFRLDVSDPNF